ncbi:MAG: cytochrome c oxidase subunit II [Fimbriimonadaceae bacterium]
MGDFALRPDNASNFANEFDALFYILTALTVLFTAIVMAFLIYFVIRYRKGNNVDRSRRVHEHLMLEITWSVIPLVLGLGVFAWGAKLFVDMRTPPKDAIEIFVMGKQWMWHIQHMNGVRENNMLTVPVNKPVKLTMVSQDVIHAFYVPEFRIQYMVVPGRYTQQWFRATKTGSFKILCNMYCGTAHSEMVGRVRVLSEADYQRWLQGEGEDLKPITQSIDSMGKDLYEDLVCMNCHTEKDTPRGPSLFAIAGSLRKLADGSTKTADDEYLRDALLDPEKHITAGYDRTMPTYKEDLNEEQVLWMIAYLKTLGSPVQPAPNSKSEPAPGGGSQP